MTYAIENPTATVLVIGAGELGLSVLRALSHKAENTPTRVSVLLRQEAIEARNGPQKARLDELSALGIELVAGDLQHQSVAELSALFRPFQTVINCSGFVGGAGTQLKITEAVLAAEVARYFPWQFGVDYDVVGMGSGQQVWDEQLAVRQRLRNQSQTEWLIISTGIFTSYLFEPSFGVVDAEHHRVYGLGSWDYAVTLTTPEDIGRLTAEIYFHQPQLANQIVYIAGDTLTYQQLADLMQAHWGGKITRQLLDKQQLLAAVAQHPDDMAAKYRLAFARPDGLAWDKATTFNAQQGIETTTARQWLAQHQRR